MMPYKILVVVNEPTDLECTKIVLEEDPDFQFTGFLDPDSAIKSILFTSAHAEPTIIQAANEVGVKVLSKDQFFDAEVRMM